MLAIDTTSATRKVTPNLLPCSIKHAGPIDAEKRHWSPSSLNNDASQSSVVFFRGRKLCGRNVKVPKGYQGAVLQTTGRSLPRPPPSAQQLRQMEEEDGDENVTMEQRAEVKMMERVAAFDQITLWGHETLPLDDDEYVKAVRECLAFSETLHSYQSPPTEHKT